MKCIYCQELLFHEEPSITFEAKELSEGAGDSARGDRDGGTEKGWDNLIGDLQDNEGFWGIDGDNVFVQTIV